MEEYLFIFEKQSQLCQALGHVVRLRIVHELIGGPKCVNGLVAALGDVPQPTVSRHLAILRSAGVLSTHRRGMEVVYQIANPKIVGVCEMMRSILVERESWRFDVMNRIQI